jgi:dTDP-4-amino-4,6-dideoxygalactose transaminase
MIPVSKPFLPDRKKLDAYIDGIYRRAHLTNAGPLVHELTARLREYLGVEHLLLVANGTLALQLAYAVLGVKGTGSQAITTPFSFAATSNSLSWEGIEPLFADIDDASFCISPSAIAAVMQSQVRAIVPVHVYGNACDVVAIEQLARQHNVKTIYDGAHAFGVKLESKSLLNYGDATTLSLHATKLFHSVEGGAIIFQRAEDLALAHQYINFGYRRPGELHNVGINAKMSEFHAAMGLAVLDEIDDIMQQRAEICQFYTSSLKNVVQLPQRHPLATENYAYFPVLLQDETQLLRVKAKFEQADIQARRYFYPSLDTLRYSNQAQYCPVSRNIASRSLCLPLFPGLAKSTQKQIVSLLLDAL